MNAVHTFRALPPPSLLPVQMAAELATLPCLLLMEFVKGRPLLECADAFKVDGVNTIRVNTFKRDNATQDEEDRPSAIIIINWNSPLNRLS